MITGAPHELVVAKDASVITESWATAPKRSVCSKLWQSDYLPNAGVPSLAELMSDHLGLDAATSEMLERGIDDDVRSNMY